MLFGLVAMAPAGMATPISTSGSMEGNLSIAAGDWIAAGYHFTMPGNHPTASVYFAYATLTLPVTCADGTTHNIVIPMNPGPWSDAANSSQWVPWQDQAAPSAFQGAVQAPDLCAGGLMNNQVGATFTADVQSNITLDPVNVQFHYRVPAAKGKGNTDCADPNSPGAGKADVCGASEGPTVSLTPSPSCLLTASGFNGQGNKYIQITMQDASSGIQSIQVTSAVNATVSVPAFIPGTTAPIVAVATKTDQSQGASVALTVTGTKTVTHCDPDW